MKLIEPSFEIWDQSSGLEGIYKQIERSGKICYKSEHTIKKGSAKLFVDRLINMKHLSVLEHGTVYLKIPFGRLNESNLFENEGIAEKYSWDEYSFIKTGGDEDYWYITSNYRVLIENNWLDDLQYLCEPTEVHEKRITVHFVLPIGISREFCRHRAFSFSEMSTRYCNFNKDKFGNELTFIEDNWSSHAALRIIEDEYIYAVNHGRKPQEARNILPLCTKTELVMTGFVSDWKHFFDLRALGTTGAPHPQAKELAEPLMKEFERRNLLCITQ